MGELSLTTHVLSRDLFDAGCVQIGEFTLKSGQKSPIYFDLRLLVSHPGLLAYVARVMAVRATVLTFDRIAAVPLAGLPIATALSLYMRRPMIYPRPEVKEHGTRKSIEGTFEQGETALVVDDLITTGASKLEVIEPLEAAGLKVKDVLVLIDREQGGVEDLAKRGYKLHAAITLRQILDSLCDEKHITEEQRTDVMIRLGMNRERA